MIFLLLVLPDAAFAQSNCKSGQKFYTLSFQSSTAAVFPNGNAVDLTETQNGSVTLSYNGDGAETNLSQCFQSTTNFIDGGGYVRATVNTNESADIKLDFCEVVEDPYIFIGNDGHEEETTIEVYEADGTTPIPVVRIDGEADFFVPSAPNNHKISSMTNSGGATGYVQIQDGTPRSSIVLKVNHVLSGSNVDAFNIGIGYCIDATSTPPLATYECAAGATEERIDFDALGLLSSTLQTNGGSQSSLNTGFKDENGSEIVFSNISTSQPSHCGATFASVSNVNSSIPSIDQETGGGEKTGNTITYEFANPTKFRIESGGADMDAGEFVRIRTFDASNNPVDVTAKLSSYPTAENVILNGQAAMDIAASEVEIFALANTAQNWEIQAVNPVSKVEITIVTYSSAAGNDIVEYDFFVCDNPVAPPGPGTPILCGAGQKFFTTSHFTSTSAAFADGSGVTMTEMNVVEDPVISYNESGSDGTLSQCFVNTTNFIEDGGHIRVLAEGNDAVDFKFDFCEAVTNPFIFVGNDGIESETTIGVFEADGTTPIPVVLIDGDGQFKVTAPNIIGSDELEGGESGYVQIQDGTPRTSIVLKVVRAANQGDLDGWNMGIGACLTPNTAPPLAAYACPGDATEERIDFSAIGLMNSTLQTNGGSQTNLNTGYFDENGQAIVFSSIATSGPSHCGATFASVSEVNAGTPSIDQETGGGANTGNTITYEFANPTKFRIESDGADMDAGEYVRIRTFDAGGNPVAVTAKLSSYPTAENVLLNGQATMDISGSEIEVFALANTAQNWEIQAVNPVSKVEITIVTYSDAAGNDIVEYDFFVCDSPVTPPGPGVGTCSPGQKFYTLSHFGDALAMAPNGNAVDVTVTETGTPQLTWNESGAETNLSQSFQSTTNFIDGGGYFRVLVDGDESADVLLEFCEPVTNPFIFIGNDGPEDESTIAVFEMDGTTPIPVTLIDGEADFYVQAAPNDHVMASLTNSGGATGYTQIQDNVARTSFLLRIDHDQPTGSNLDGYNIGVGFCVDPETTPHVPYDCAAGTSEEQIDFPAIGLLSSTLQSNGGSQSNLMTPFKDENGQTIGFSSIATSGSSQCTATFASTSEVNASSPQIDQETGGGQNTGNTITYTFVNPTKFRIQADGADMDAGEFVRVKAFDAANNPVAVNAFLSSFTNDNVLLNNGAADTISTTEVEVFATANTAVHWGIQAPTPVKRVEVTIVSYSDNANNDITEYDMFVCAQPCSADIPSCGAGTEARGVTTSWSAHTMNTATGALGSTNMAWSNTGNLEVRRHYGNGASTSFNGCDPDQSLEPATGGFLNVSIPNGTQSGTVTIMPSATVTNPVLYLGRLHFNTTLDFANSTDCVQLLKQRGGLEIVGSTQVSDNGGFQGYGIVQLVGTFDNANPIVFDYTSSGVRDYFRFSLGMLQCLAPNEVESCGPVLEPLTCAASQMPAVRTAAFTKTSNTSADASIYLDGEQVNFTATVGGTGLNIARAATNRPRTFYHPNCFAPQSRGGGWLSMRKTATGTGTLTWTFDEPVSNPLIYVRNLVRKDLDFSATTDVDGNAACCLVLVNGCQGLNVAGSVVSDAGMAGEADGIVQLLGEFTTITMNVSGPGYDVFQISIADPNDQECADEPTCEADVDLTVCSLGELRSKTASWTSKSGNSMASGTWETEENGTINVTSTTTGNVNIRGIRSGGAAGAYRNENVYGVRPISGGSLCYHSPANGAGQIKITFPTSVSNPLIYVGQNGLIWTKLDFSATVDDSGSPLGCLAKVTDNGQFIQTGSAIEDNGTFPQASGLYQLIGDFTEITIDVTKTQNRSEYFCLSVGEPIEGCDPTPPPCETDLANCSGGQLRSTAAEFSAHTQSTLTGVLNSDEYDTPIMISGASDNTNAVRFVRHRTTGARNQFSNINDYEARPSTGGYTTVYVRPGSDMGTLTFTFDKEVTNPLFHLGRNGLAFSQFDFTPTVDVYGSTLTCLAEVNANGQAQQSGSVVQDLNPGGVQARGTYQLLGTFTEIKIKVSKVTNGGEWVSFTFAEPKEECDPNPINFVCENDLVACDPGQNGTDAISFTTLIDPYNVSGTYPHPVEPNPAVIAFTGSNPDLIFQDVIESGACGTFDHCMAPRTGGFTTMVAKNNGGMVTFNFAEPVADPVIHLAQFSRYNFGFGQTTDTEGNAPICLADICGINGFTVNGNVVSDNTPGSGGEASGAVQLIGEYSSIKIVVSHVTGTQMDRFKITIGEPSETCQPAPPNINVAGTTGGTICWGTATGSIDMSVSGGSGGFTYVWSNGATTQDVSGLVAGEYTVSVTDANGCIATETFLIEQHPQQGFMHSQTNLLCYGDNDGTINVTGTGGVPGYTYDWADMPGTSNPNNRTGLVAGEYSLTITDAAGCTLVAVFEITQPPLLTLGTFVTNTCVGEENGKIVLQPDGGTPAGNPPYTYEWADLSGSFQPSVRINLAPGTYYATVTDANGCTAETSATVIETTPPMLMGIVDDVCEGSCDGKINLMISGGSAPFSFDWADIPGTNNSEDRNSLCAGDYTVTVMDFSGCTAEITISVGTNPDIEVEGEINGLCAGSNQGSIDMTVTGGTPGYVFDWADLPGSNNIADRTNLAPGIYDVTVTDAAGCSETASFTLMASTGFELGIESENPLCPNSGDGSIDLTVIGGVGPFIYNWLDMPGTMNSEDRTGLDAGTYTVIVTDGNGCTQSTSKTLTAQDNTPPMANCQNLSISLNNGGEANITAAQVNNGSSDNCGDITLSLSQTNFTCDHVGMNTVTLTVTDGSGLTSTCDATVTIAPFVTITDVDVADESCSGFADGSIMVTAEAPAGQMFYSIDGGQTFNTTGIFENLAPGTYDVLVQVQKTAMCVAETTATVGAGPAATTWYADMDGDGYSNGQTISSCVQPSGYFAAGDLTATSGDCDDSDPEQFPGQTWYQDEDGDGFGTGMTLIQCSQPAGYVSGTAIASATGDCDDSDPTVFPGAMEVCDGIDNDCDGEIDEGATGGLTYVGNVTFTTQAQVDAFSQCYSIIDGNLTIQNTVITDLSNLINIVEVTGNVRIQSTGLVNMAGLENLTTVGGDLFVRFNGSLTSLDGLEGVTAVGDDLYVYYNGNLTDCCAIHDLINNGGVNDLIQIFRNETGCDSQAEINTDCGGNFNGNGGSNAFGSKGGHGTASMLVYPNPSDSEVNIAIDAEFENGGLTVFDATGRIVLVHDLETGAQSVRLDAGTWKNGIYLVQLRLDGEYLVEKLVIK